MLGFFVLGGSGDLIAVGDEGSDGLVTVALPVELGSAVAVLVFADGVVGHDGLNAIDFDVASNDGFFPSLGSGIITEELDFGFVVSGLVTFGFGVDG